MGLAILILICFFIIIIYFSKTELHEIRELKNKSEVPIVYRLDLTLTRKNGHEDCSSPDYSQLYDVFEDSVIRKIKNNIEIMMEEQGNNEFVVFESCYLASFDYLENNPPLIVGDKLILDIAGAYHLKTDNSMLVPCILAQNGIEISTLHIYNREPAYHILNNAKITGTYVGDMERWINGNIKDNSTKVIIFYERNENGDDDDMPITPKEQIEDSIFYINQVLQSINQAMRQKAKPN